MAEIALEEIMVDADGRLFVVPVSGSDRMYPFIYRAGKGVTWAPAARAFVAAEPERWNHSELLAHIIKTVCDECGDTLLVNDATRMTSVPEDLSLTLRSFGR